MWLARLWVQRLVLAHKPNTVDYDSVDPGFLEEKTNIQSVGIYPTRYMEPGTRLEVDLNYDCAAADPWIALSVMASANTAYNCHTSSTVECFNKTTHSYELADVSLVSTAACLSELDVDTSYRGYNNPTVPPDADQIKTKLGRKSAAGVFPIPPIHYKTDGRTITNYLHFEPFGVGLYIPTHALHFKCDASCDYRLSVLHTTAGQSYMCQEGASCTGKLEREKTMLTVGIGTAENWNFFDFVSMPSTLPLHHSLDYQASVEAPAEDIGKYTDVETADAVLRDVHLSHLFFLFLIYCCSCGANMQGMSHFCTGQPPTLAEYRIIFGFACATLLADTIAFSFSGYVIMFQEEWIHKLTRSRDIEMHLENPDAIATARQLHIWIRVYLLLGIILISTAFMWYTTGGHWKESTLSRNGQIGSWLVLLLLQPLCCALLTSRTLAPLITLIESCIMVALVNVVHLRTSKALVDRYRGAPTAPTVVLPPKRQTPPAGKHVRATKMQAMKIPEYGMTLK